MVIYEDNHLLVVNKSCGDLVQGDSSRDKTILDKYKKYIKFKYDKPGDVFLHPTHRLDRPVSGCLILARTSKGLKRMNEAFRLNEVGKTYHAISEQRSDHPEGKLSQYLIKDKVKNRAKIAKKGHQKAKKAEMSFSLAASTGSKFLYEVHPKTGRSHQIRIQLSSIGSPIIGDLKYGGQQGLNDRTIYLHCSALSFIHPVKKEKMMVSCRPYMDQIWSEFKEFLR